MKLRVVGFPMGLMSLASVLRDKHEVRILDARLDILEPADVLSACREYKPDVVGFSCFTSESGLAYDAARLIKESGAQVRVVMGGPHATMFAEDVLERGDFDFIVLGEGESTFPELLDCIEGGTDPRKVAGIAYRDGSEIVKTVPRPLIENLDEIPFPAWDAIDMERYFEWPRFSHMGRSRHMALVTSRGCPYHCVYCHRLFGMKCRTRSAANVLAEIAALRERYGMEEFEIYDDIFNVDKRRAGDICDGIIASGRKTKLCFPNGLRADIMDEELVDKMRRAGTYFLAYAVETASRRLQKLMKKNLNLERAKAVIAQTAKKGIFTHGFFMLGFPTETEAEMRETVEFACRSGFHTASFFCVNPFKGTELFEMCAKLGKNIDSDWKHYSYGKGVWPMSELSPVGLAEMRRKAYRRFYLRPKMLRTVAALPKKAALFEHFGHFVRKSLS